MQKSTACAAIFVPLANETYFDLCGSLGFLSTAFVSLYYPALKFKASFMLGNGANVPLPALSSFSPRQLLITTCLSLWAARMGAFLAQVSIIAAMCPDSQTEPQLMTARNQVWGRLSFR